MRIGVLSDTHNHIGNLRKALRLFEQEGVHTLIHCGDMANMATARHMKDFQVIYVSGNVDDTAEAVNEVVLGLNPDNEAGLTFSGKLDGVAIAAAHGHQPSKLDDFINARRYRYVFHGHTHRRRDDVVGKTRVINPGALGGVRYEPRSACLVDLRANVVRFVTIADY